MRIEADRARCTSAGNCARVAPELFDQGAEDGIVVVLDPQPSEALRNAARDAESLCPAQAILVSDD
jgi:ferredoxin